MEHFDRPPTKAQQWLAVVLSLLAAAATGSYTALFWVYAKSPYVGGFFACAFLLCCYLFYRALRTAPRTLRSSETRGLSYVFVVFGGLCVGAFLLAPGLSAEKLMLFGPGLSMLCAGLIELAGSRR